MNEITIFKNERFGEVRTATSESGEPLIGDTVVVKNSTDGTGASIGIREY